jgi:hypothetical protein
VVDPQLRADSQVVVLEVVPERRRSRAAVSPYGLHRIQSTKVLTVRESPK